MSHSAMHPAMEPVPTADADTAWHDWMAPVATDAPCGPDLEYDPEFVVLSAQVAAKMDTQYGDFVGVPEPVNWSDVDRDCRRLMMRSKDMRVAVLFTRGRTRLAAAAGLAEGLGLLAAWLAAWPEGIHPQPGVDEDPNAASEIRMNALQSLTDTDGLLADVRDIALTRSSAVRLQVRDVERAFIQPRPSDALAPESVMRQLEDLRVQQPDALVDFDRSLGAVIAIEAWSREHLGVYAPDLSVLTRLLRRVAGEEGSCLSGDEGESAPGVTHRTADEAVERQDARDPVGYDELPAGLIGGRNEPVSTQPATTPAPMPAPVSVIHDRAAATEHIRVARHWFEQHEPSSPVAVLLRRAEQLVGKRYTEVVNAIPAELLAQWEGE